MLAISRTSVTSSISKVPPKALDQTVGRLRSPLAGVNAKASTDKDRDEKWTSRRRRMRDGGNSDR